MNKSYVAVLMLLLFIQACDEKKVEDSFTINFKAKFQNQAFQSGAVITDSSNKKWKFNDLNFYISKLRLVKQDGGEESLSELSYIDLKAANPANLKFSQIPLGAYKGIKFNTGLTPTQNDVNPNFLDDKDPRNYGGYWEWLKYIFIRLDGRADLDNDSNFETLLIYHIGTDELLREVFINTNFEIKAGAVQKTITLDLDKVFFATPGLDISNLEQSYTHSDPKADKNFPTAIIFADNFSKSFSLE